MKKFKHHLLVDIMPIAVAAYLVIPQLIFFKKLRKTVKLRTKGYGLNDNSST